MRLHPSPISQVGPEANKPCCKFGKAQCAVCICLQRGFRERQTSFLCQLTLSIGTRYLICSAWTVYAIRTSVPCRPCRVPTDGDHLNNIRPHRRGLNSIRPSPASPCRHSRPNGCRRAAPVKADQPPPCLTACLGYCERPTIDPLVPILSRADQAENKTNQG
jgi:hypothetical protein